MVMMMDVSVFGCKVVKRPGWGVREGAGG